jgi:paraquat-inducible protein B
MTELPKPTIDKRKRLSVIWIIPIVALLLGIWMVVHKQMSQGPTIDISFKNADGIVAGKTKVQYLNVQVGQVQSVNLNDKMDGVVINVQLDPTAKDLLLEDTEFWVVRARIGAGNISGLGTLLGGAYIELSPGIGTAKSKEPHHYVGLEVPPLTPAGAPGLKLSLYSEKAASVSTGDVVLYHGYTVGRIEGVSFDSERRLVHYDLFIDAPYDQLVNSAVRFWNISGIEMSASASGIEVLTGSLDSVLLGGVAFSLLPGGTEGEPVKNGAEFELYDTYKEMLDQPYQYHVEYVMEFEQSLRGLLPGAPVEYRGIPIGQVKEILFKTALEDRKAGDAPLPVLISFEPGRAGLPDTKESLDTMKKNLVLNVADGMRGSLETGNMITGSLFINIDYRNDAEKATMGEAFGYQTIPTVVTGFDRMEEQVSDFLEKINALPLNETMESVDQAMVALTDTLKSMDTFIQDTNREQVSAELSNTLKETQRVLSGMSPDSAAYQSIEDSMMKLNQTLSNLDQLTRTLKDKPNSLILPTNFPSDPTPGANH